MPMTPLPPVPSRNDPANFSERADALLGALPQFVTEANSLEQSLQRAATTGSSTSELTVGLGSVSLIAEPGKAWFVGAWLYIVASPDIQNYMVGQVVSYDAETGAMSVLVSGFDGAGTFSSWLIGLATPQADGHLIGWTADEATPGVRVFATTPAMPGGFGGFYKADRSTCAFLKTGPGAISIKGGTKINVGGAWIEFSSSAPVTMPTLTAGEDYAIWCTPAGALVCNADPFSSPASAPVAGSRKIGGFHYGLVAPGTTPASGGFATSGFTNQGGSMIWTQAAVDRIAGINEFSLWDLAWRCKGQQRGMTLDPQTETWHAIYFCSVHHITNGISRYNTDVASGTVLPRIPLAYGGNGSTNYGRLSQYECEEIAASFGLRLPAPDEFRSAMFGVTEGQSLGGAASTIPLTTRQPGYTSRLGIEQATGHESVFARGNSSNAGSAFIAGPNRGYGYGNLSVTLLGGARDGAANSGSRASGSNFVAWSSDWSVALRASGDHLKHV
ncbi:MAG: hypothetical protein RBT42_09200 [Aquabacterium sp.]|jgi:hypothetical protein|uniref:phage major tropism determinant n=1 Tax=Aquabacterium sp. TaxID=1872578 RepID=UPI002A370190|nr:hypothetical protein [Aquabacterium sp.]MDX9843919.1 hypothetical protein [Aquabacterium sp.]